MSWTQHARQMQKEAHVFYFAFKHPRTPWYARMIAACTAGYLLSPVQLIPSFIPVIGLLDDVLVVFLGVKLLQRVIPADVLAECRQFAEAGEIRRKEEIKSGLTVVVPITVAVLWVLAALAASAAMASYVSH